MLQSLSALLKLLDCLLILLLGLGLDFLNGFKEFGLKLRLKLLLNILYQLLFNLYYQLYLLMEEVYSKH